MESLQEIANDLKELLENRTGDLDDTHADVLSSLENMVFRINDQADAFRRPFWNTDSRPAPQVHFRVNVSGLKRVPDATFTIDGDIRDVDMDDFFAQRDRFQAEVDERYPLPSEDSK